MEPYVGLDPYTEEDQDIFFGRDSESAILVDKILSNKLTLLFAASGVGKSSLLQAAVIPELKRQKNKNLDVVNYKDWVSNPLLEFKNKTIEVLKLASKIDSDFKIDSDLSLNDFLNICSTFASEPLVIILDQFEEFFQYQRYSDKLIRFVEQLSSSIVDRDASISFLISMREDFALNLNVFKDYLPTTLFENYFRLEKLKVAKAKEAINSPVEKIGYRYQKGLLDKLLIDLAARERERHLDRNMITQNAQLFVEPPHVQIVCKQLWEEEKQNKAKVIRQKTYINRGRAKGFVNSYFENVMISLTLAEKKLASLAFNLLITPRGTKMAYAVKDLCELLRVNEKELNKVLDKLSKARVLRGQERKREMWYELSHDIFSRIIYKWNEAFKARQRTKKAFILVGNAIVVLLVLLFAYNVVINLTSYHLRISDKKEISRQIELYRGNANSFATFGLHKYIAETSFNSRQVEPDKQFNKKQIGDYKKLNLELIGHLPKDRLIKEYWESGEINEAFNLADMSISKDNLRRTKSVIHFLAGFRSQESFKILKEHLSSSDNEDIQAEIISELVFAQFSGVTECLLPLIINKNTIVRRSVASALGALGSESAVAPLIGLLTDPDPIVRSSAASALGALGSESAVAPLIGLLKDPEPVVRSSAASALGALGSESAVAPLIGLLKDQEPVVRSSATSALVVLGSESAVAPLIGLLTDPDPIVRSSAASALGALGSESAVAPLIGLLKDQESVVKSNAAAALGGLGSESAVAPLIGLLTDPDPIVRSSAASALGVLGSESAVAPLIGLLKDENPAVQSSTASALVRINSESAVAPLIGLLKDENPAVQSSTASALVRINSESAVAPLIGLLKDQDSAVRRSAASALGDLGSESAVAPLLSLLKDQDWVVRSEAASALVRLGSESAVAPLLRILKDQDSFVQSKSSAAFVLGGLGSESAVEPLVALLKDQDSFVRSSAASALGVLGNEPAVAPLIGLLKDQESVVRSSAASALGGLSSESAVAPLIGLLKDQDSAVRRSAASALGDLGSESAEKPLLALLKDEKSVVRLEAARALSTLGSESAVAPLVALLKDQDSVVRSSAASALGVLDNESAVEPLLGLFKDQDSVVRSNAASALGVLGNESAVEPLLGLFKDQDQVVRSSAASALVRLGSESAVAPLLGLLKDQESVVRSSAASALGLLGSESAVAPLIGLLKDQNPAVRSEAARALGILGSKSAIEPVIGLLKDPEGAVRSNAAIALGKLAADAAIKPLKNIFKKESKNQLILAAVLLSLNQEGVFEFLQEQTESIRFSVRKSIAEVLGQVHSKKGAALLIKMLSDKNPEVIIRAIKSLGLSQAESSLPSLHKTLSEDTKPKITEAIIEAFGNIASIKSIVPLKKIVMDSKNRHYIRLSAIAALGNIGTAHEEAIDELIEILDNIEKKYHYKIILAIGKTGSQRALSPLMKYLKNEEKRAVEWRTIRGEVTSKMDEWWVKEKKVRPRRQLEFGLAYAISKIDPNVEGAKLLHHDLYFVRKGAYTGLSKVGTVTLIKRLDEERMASSAPIYQRAAYRAIDGALIHIEVTGGETELAELKAFLKRGIKHKGVKTRVEWTIERLKEKAKG